ncbi:discoidin domain-containing protein [Flavobacteriaceae bacterium]|nr:discoidin domain-containing protein [Flavobacteriaceae bacterium]
MKRILFLLFLCVAVHSLSAQRGIGTNSPDPSAVLDLTSTTQGFLPPRMTYAQMTAIVSPTAGLTVYCTDCEPVGFHYYDGSFFLHTQTGATSGALSTLVDTSVTFTGSSTLDFGVAYISSDGLTASIPYTGWGGNTHNPIAFNSTDVWGLMATLDPASLTAGAGNAIFNITGTAAAGGTSPALFNINLGGLSATFSKTIISTVLVEQAAGLESGVIPDAQLTASSFFNSVFAPSNGRLNQTGNNWTAITANASQWFQVDLGQVEIVSAVATQGRNNFDQWVTSYTIQYSDDDITYFDYNGAQVFTANNDRNTIVKNNFTPTFSARYVRFLPQTWSGNVSARFEVYILR